MTSHTFGDDRLRGTVTRQPDHFTFELMDLPSGITWGPVPLVVLEIYAKAEFRVEPVRTYRIDQVEELPDGLHLTLGDGMRSVRIGLSLRIRAGELQVTLPMPEVYEDRPHRHRLFSVIPFPGLLRTGPDGRLLLPLNSGVLCCPAGKPAVTDRFMIYGEQCRWELLPTLPVCGIETPLGGLLALARQAAEETECHVRTDGAGNGSTGLAFNLRQFWPDPVEFSTRQIVLCPRPAGTDLLHFAAHRLRRHVVEDLGKPTLRQRAAESPELAALLPAYIMKLFCAVENRGAMMQGQAKDPPVTFRRVMTFDQARRNLERLHRAGLSHIHTQSVGWNPRGHDGLWPTRFPIDERLGGEAGFRELLAAGNRLGYTMTVHDNWKSAYPGSPDFHADEVVHDQWGQPMGLGEWGGGVSHIPATWTWPDERIESELRRVKALGLTGPAYLDGMGNPLYRDYHPRHPATRTGFARATCRLLELARKVHGAAGTECGFLYCCIPADSMCTGGSEWHLKLCWPDWPVTALAEKRVPLWSLALHGLILLENQGLSWRTAMQTVLFGDHPRDEWSALPGVMPVLDDRRILALRANFDLCLGRFGHLQLETLDRWEEPADGVQATTFSDGTRVVADFTRNELLVNDQPVARPAGL